MNYTEIARQEILQQIGAAAPERKRRFLAALTKCAGSIALKNKKMAVEYAIKDQDSAAALVSMLKDLYGGEIECRFTAGAQPAQFTVRLGAERANRALEEWGLTHYEQDRLILVDGMPALDAVNNRETAAQYLQGIFAGAGSLYLPDAQESRGYRLELALGDETFADQIERLLHRCGLHYRKVERSGGFSVISKSGEQIVDLLALIGANSAVMDIYDLMALKESLNDINRHANAYAANLDKISKANSEAVAAIETLRARGALEGLEPRLLKIAQARLSDKEASLGDLAQKLGMSKSTLSRELSKLKELANQGGSADADGTDLCGAVGSSAPK